jgi:hypothetical protein
MKGIWFKESRVRRVKDVLRYKKVMGIPVGILVVAFLILTVGIGGAVAAFNFGQVAVTGEVTEPMAFSVLGNVTGWDPDTQVWSVGLWPGQTKVLDLHFVNQSPLDYLVTAQLSGGVIGYGGNDTSKLPVLTAEHATFTVPKNSSVDESLTLSSGNDTPPCDYEWYVNYSR